MRHLIVTLGFILALAGAGHALAMPDCGVQRCFFLPALSGPPPAPTATPTVTLTPTRTTVPPTATPQLPPPSFNNCQADPNGALAPNYPVRITGIDKDAETVTLRNVSHLTVDLTGWRMCSITGNQEHPISGVLAPGETRVFPGPVGPIWNNSLSDPGALYNPNGQLASYWDD